MPENLNVQLLSKCYIPLEILESLKNLVESLSPFVLANPQPCLKEIWIVPDESLEGEINNLHRNYSLSKEGTYRTGQIPSNGVAVPVETEGGLVCYIVLKESLIRQISPNKYPPFEVVSTVLEELLHTNLYAILGAQPTVESRQSSDLITLARTIHDEYAISRWKSTIAAQYTIFEYEGKMQTLRLSYGEPIAERLDAALIELDKIISSTAKRQMPFESAYQRVLYLLHRSILDPLARDAGFRVINSDINNPNSNSKESKYYDLWKSFWDEIEFQLDRSYSTEFRETNSSIDEIATIINRFLVSKGIAVEKMPNGGAYVNFFSLS